MGASTEIQQAVFSKLDGTAALINQLANHAYTPAKKAVYDHVPQDVKPESKVAFPYVAIGEEIYDPADTDDAFARETLLTVHTFSRYLGDKEAKSIMDAIKAALHDGALTFGTEKFVFCYLESSAIATEPDGVTRHGVQNFRIYTEGT